MAQSLVGTRLGSYDIATLIAAGGMGEVYLAQDRKLGRRVAIKTLPARVADDPVARERLRREAVAAAALDHPFICKVFELGEEAGVAYIAMEFVEGQTLGARLRSSRPPFDEAHGLALEIGEALAAAHARAFVHRDLKPSNIMVTPQGHAKVMDFGLAKRMDFGAESGPDQLTESGGVVGTPDYMSPEQLEGADLDARSDLFAFGIVLCELFGGAHPFRRKSSVETMAAILRDPPALGGELTAGLLVLVRRLLAKAPADRYASMAEVMADLTRLPTLAPDTEPVSPRSPMVGREAERRELIAHLERAMGGSGSLVLIGGEPGLGKTRLASEIRDEARRRGLLCVTGSCYEMEGSVPYSPFVEMLESASRAVPREAFRHAVGDDAPEVAKLLPELRRMFPDIPPALELPAEQQRRFLFNAYRSFVERAARIAPTMAVFEDIHWADESTVLLLRHLAQTAGSVPLLMVGTYRDVGVADGLPFARMLPDMLRDRTATRIRPSRLSEAEVARQLESLAGGPPEPTLVRAIHERTEGNPFFVEELFRHLAGGGELASVPEGVRVLIGRRMERLAADTRRVLATAAVVGRTFSLPLLEHLESGRPDAALDAVEEAERAHLLLPAAAGSEPQYRFVHELIRETLSEGLSLPRRQRLHARIADAPMLESNVSALAHHLFHAGALADCRRTIDQLAKAAGQASATAAHEEALTQLDRALSLESDPDSGDLRLRRSEALRCLGRFEDAFTECNAAIDRFFSKDETAKAADASAGLSVMLLWRIETDRAAQVLDRALAFSPMPKPLECQLLMIRALHRVGNTLAEEGDRDFAAAEEIRKDIPDPRLALMALQMDALIRVPTLEVSRAGDSGRKAAAMYRAVGHLWGVVEAEWIVGVSDMLGGHPYRNLSETDGQLAAAERVGHISATWMWKFMRTMSRFAAADFEEAERLAADSLQFAEAYGIPYGMLEWGQIGFVAHCRDLWPLAESRLRRAVAMEPPNFQITGTNRGMLFLASAVEGAPDALDLGAAIELPVAGKLNSNGRWQALVSAVEGLALLGRREQVAGLHPAAEQLLTQGVQAVGTMRLAATSAAIAAGAAGNWSRAEELHQLALQQAATAPYTVSEPVSRQWYAEMLRERGDRERARALMLESLAQYESQGMPGYARRAGERIATVY